MHQTWQKQLSARQASQLRNPVHLGSKSLLGRSDPSEGEEQAKDCRLPIISAFRPATVFVRELNQTRSSGPACTGIGPWRPEPHARCCSEAKAGKCGGIPSSSCC